MVEAAFSNITDMMLHRQLAFKQFAVIQKIAYGWMLVLPASRLLSMLTIQVVGM
jgi:phosphate/sulfate permease